MLLQKQLTPPNKYKLIKLGIEFGEGGKRLSCGEIATLLNIAERTAYRYIALLRKDFNAPIILVRKRSGNIYVCSHPWSMIEALKAC